MRSKRLLLSTFSSLLYMFVDVLVAFLVPRLILVNYGSSNNGMLASITQFLGCSELLFLGISNVTRTALYKPLSERNHNAVNSIMSATMHFMRKVATIYLIILLLFSLCYPIILRQEYGFVYVSSLVLILGLESFFRFFFAVSSRILLDADQKSYIAAFVNIVTLILTTTVSVILINMGCKIHVVKLGTALVQICNPIFIYLYVKKRYNIDKNAVPDNTALNQRWDACTHSLANFVTKNTDIVIITLFANVKEVSVYTVYYLVINGLNKIGSAFCNGVEAAFGSIISRDDYPKLRMNTAAIESGMYAISTAVYATSIILIVPFISIYTAGIHDIEYRRYVFGVLASMGGYFLTMRLPYQSLVHAAGKYKETKNASIIESVLNLTLSLILVNRFGLVGVTIGTVVAMAFRTIQFAYYGYKNIINVKISRFWKKLLVSLVDITVIVFIFSLIQLNPVTYVQFFACGVLVFTVSAFIAGMTMAMFWRSDLVYILNILLTVVKRKK